MKYTFNKNTNMKSTFIMEDFFPAIVEFSNEELNNLFIEFNYRDTDMFELSVNPDTKILKRFALTLCNHFEIKNEALFIPDFENGSIVIEGPDKTECDSFIVKVFSDGLLIETSTENAEKHLKCGQIIFGISSADKVVTIHIVNLSAEEIAHVKSELIA